MSTQQTYRKKIITEHHPFWDIIDKIELPIVKFLQTLLFASKFHKFWVYAAWISSSTSLSYYPSILFSLGLADKAKQLSTSLVFYALLSSSGKFFLKRRRPGSYPDTYSYDCSSTSSFPSRHTIGATVFANFTPIKWPFIIFMMCDRIALGQHFLFDCIAGYGIGELAVFLGQYLNNINLTLVILLLSLRMWSSCSRILGGILPIIIAEKVNCTPFVFPLVFLRSFIKKRPLFNKPVNPLCNELFAAALTTFIFMEVNSGFLYLREKGYICDKIWEINVLLTEKIHNIFDH
ncbi:PAP2 superfamily protein [Histomonas meleagridis]|uniref:PAP2 superfamily protein n=1 Tax=Histomonas meleagridis TaxID=135588 RepID=UPI0035595E42|nr:PAP2 superfamily protein [Histomonas meleagridis]KAH0802574.1 PAP2 superfamily protein [Histomonas meleagridis]